MKKFFYATIGTLLYVAPLLAIYLQIRGGDRLCKELENIRKAIERLHQKEKHELPRKNLHIHHNAIYVCGCERICLRVS